jgi:hypothetical protein
VSPLLIKIVSSPYKEGSYSNLKDSPVGADPVDVYSTSSTIVPGGGI